MLAYIALGSCRVFAKIVVQSFQFGFCSVFSGLNNIETFCYKHFCDQFSEKMYLHSQGVFITLLVCKGFLF